MPRAVLDTSVFVSALITPSGPTARILVELRAGAFELVTSRALLDELAGVLLREKFRAYVTTEEAAAFVELVRVESTVLADPPAGEVAASADPADEYLVALARTASAVLVSGDKHLLTLGDRLPVLSPAAFLGSLESG